MWQVENEYGAGGGRLCDFAYTSHLRDLFRSGLDSRVPLFTVDNPYTQNMRCGKIPQVYSTIDFGPGKWILSSNMVGHHVPLTIQIKLVW